jgi:hypothetical protein
VTQQKLFSLQWLNLNRLVTGIVFIAIFTMAIRFPVDSDTWWHLRAGQTMVERHSLLTSDPFSQTQIGQPWINHGWLAQLFWYELFTLGRWPAVALGLATIITLAFWLVWQQSEGNLYLKAFALILGAISSSFIWAARPQMISFLLTALVAWLLYRFKRQGRKLLPWLPLIVLFWVNIHGGFAIAFILMIGYAVGEVFNHLTSKKIAHSEVISWPAWRHLLLTIIVCLAVVGINPYTWRMWLYPFQTVNIGVLRDFIAEWQSPNFHQPIVQPFLLMLLLLLAAIARTSHKVDWTDLALVGAWTALSLLAVRNIPLFALVCTPIFVRYANVALEEQFGPISLGRMQRLPQRLYLANWLLLSLVVVGSITQISLTLSPIALLKAEQAAFPYHAVRFIQETRPPGPIFNSYNFGGYLIFKLWPEYLVFVDGRTDLYDDEFLRTYLGTNMALPGWQTRLEKYDVQLVLIERSSPLDPALTQDPTWSKLFEDEQAVIFKREPSP